MLRIGKKAIVSFPNFAHISIRRQFISHGSMPVSPAIPFEWYDTPNIHMVTINDFENFCRNKKYPIEKRQHFSIKCGKNKKVCVPNLFAQYGLFVLDGTPFTSA
jgi:methionine biosynthesis protein MetW